MKKIIIDMYGLGHSVVVLEHGKIIDCFIDPPKELGFYPPNTFMKAKIDRRMLNMGGYFVKLPNGIQGFLKSKNKYSEGSTVSLLSQVVFEPHKAQAFTDILKTVSRYFVIKLGDSGHSFSKNLPVEYNKFEASKILKAKIKSLENIFVICRSSIANITLQEFNEEAEKAIKHMQIITKHLALNSVYFNGLARKLATETYGTEFYKIEEEKGVFERAGIWEQLEEIKNGRVYLDKGAYIIFEQTSAFVTIDVNSGMDKKFTREDINLSACNEIYRIIRVCGLGGKILIDFLSCSKTSRRKIERKISSYFSKDTVKNKIWGWTKSGVFELERKRDKIPLKLLM